MACKVVKALIAAALAWHAEADGLRIKRVKMIPGLGLVNAVTEAATNHQTQIVVANLYQQSRQNVAAQSRQNVAQSRRNVAQSRQNHNPDRDWNLEEAQAVGEVSPTMIPPAPVHPQPQVRRRSSEVRREWEARREAGVNEEIEGDYGVE